MNHFAVIGRIDGDGEDTVLCFSILEDDSDVASRMFVQVMKDSYPNADYIGTELCPIYVNHVLRSESPIKLVWSQA